MREPAQPYLAVVENKCDYSIRLDSVEGPLARFPEVGQPVVHRWECQDGLFRELIKNHKRIFRKHGDTHQRLFCSIGKRRQQ